MTKFAIVCACALLVLLAHSPNASAGKRIIINEEALRAIVEVNQEAAANQNEIRQNLAVRAILTDSCEASSRVFLEERNDKENPDRVTRYSVEVESTCLAAALIVYEKIRALPGINISFPVPKPAITGSN